MSSNYFDLPSLTPAVYGAAGDLKREVEKALRNALRHPASADDIRAYLTAALEVIAEPVEPDPDPIP